jgi:hypothetical protein
MVSICQPVEGAPGDPLATCTGSVALSFLPPSRIEYFYGSVPTLSSEANGDEARISVN